MRKDTSVTRVRDGCFCMLESEVTTVVCKGIDPSNA